MLIVNLADVASTWFVISSGKGVEVNLVVLFLGGLFSSISLPLKIVGVPVIILATAWWLTHRSEDPRLGIATIIPPVIVLGSVVANNVVVAAKKVKKTVARER